MDLNQYQPYELYQSSFLFTQTPISLAIGVGHHPISHDIPKDSPNSHLLEETENFLSKPITHHIYLDLYTLPEIRKISYLHQSQPSQKSKDVTFPKEQENNIEKTCSEIEVLIDKALQSLEGAVPTLTNIGTKTNYFLEIQKKIAEVSKILRQKNKIWHSLVILDKLSQDIFEIYRAYDKNTQKFYYVKQLTKTKEGEQDFERQVLQEMRMHLQLMKSAASTPFVDIAYQPKDSFSITYELGKGTLKDYLAFIKRRGTVWDESILLSFIIQIADKIIFSKKEGLEVQNIRPENISIDDDWSLKLYNCTKLNEKGLNKKDSVCLLTEIQDPEEEKAIEQSQEAKSVVNTMLEVIVGETFDSSKAEESLEKVKGKYPSVGKTLEQILTTQKLEAKTELPVNMDFLQKLEKYFQEYLASRIYQNLQNDKNSLNKLEELLVYEGAQDWCERTIRITTGRNHEEKQKLAFCYSYLGKLYLERGLLSEALEKYSEGLKLLEELHGKTSTQVAGVLNSMGSIYSGLGDYSKAQECLERAEGIYISAKLENSLEMARVCDNLAELHSCKKELGEALLFYERSFEIRLSLSDKLSLACSYSNIAEVYALQGYLDKAVATIKKALETLEKSEQPLKMEIAACYDRLGYFHKEQGKLDLALGAYQKAKAICLELFGPNNVRTIAVEMRITIIYILQKQVLLALTKIDEIFRISQSSFEKGTLTMACACYLKGISSLLQNRITEGLLHFSHALEMFSSQKRALLETTSCLLIIGNLHLLLNEVEKGGEKIQQALTLRSEKLGPENPQTKICQYYLGLSYHLQAKFQDASKSYEKAFKCSISDQTYMFCLHYNAACACKSSKRQREALEYFQLARDYLVKAHPQHPGLALCLHNIGELFYKSAKFDISLLQYKRALEIYEKASPVNTVALSICQTDIGNLYLEMGFHDKAHTFFEKALENRKKWLAETHSLTIESMNNMGIILSKLGKNDEALSYYQKCLEARINLYGEEHKKVADIYSNIGNVYLKMKKNEDALKSQKKALEIRLKVLPKYHHRIADSYLNLGNIYHNANRHNDAIEAFELALKIYKKTHGEKHPSLASCYTNIGVSFKALGKAMESQEKFQKALDIYMEFYPRDHPNIKNIKSQIGSGKPKPEQSSSVPKKAKASPEKHKKMLAKIVLHEANLNRSPDKKDPRYMYRMQLENLKELGFTNEEKNLKALIAARGNIAEAMNQLSK